MTHGGAAPPSRARPRWAFAPLLLLLLAITASGCWAIEVAAIVTSNDPRRTEPTPDSMAGRVTPHGRDGQPCRTRTDVPPCDAGYRCIDTRCYRDLDELGAPRRRVSAARRPSTLPASNPASDAASPPGAAPAAAGASQRAPAHRHASGRASPRPPGDGDEGTICAMNVAPGDPPPCQPGLSCVRAKCMKAAAARERAARASPRSRQRGGPYLGVGFQGVLLAHESYAPTGGLLGHGLGVKLVAGGHVTRWFALELGYGFSGHGAVMQVAPRATGQVGGWDYTPKEPATLLHALTLDGKITFPGGSVLQPFVTVGGGFYALQPHERVGGKPLYPALHLVGALGLYDVVALCQDGRLCVGRNVIGDSAIGAGFQLGGGLDVVISGGWAFTLRAAYHGIALSEPIGPRRPLLGMVSLGADLRVTF